MDEIKFELRPRQKHREQFWSIHYDTLNGQIKSINPGQNKSAEHIIITYPRVKDLLAGTANQNDYRVAFNETLGTLDLIDLKRPTEFKKKHIWKGWLSSAENQGDPLSDLRVILFNENGTVRVETSRTWSTSIKEKIDKDLAGEKISLFISDEEDPHQLFGMIEIAVSDIVERGFWEKRLWSFMNHELVIKILYHGQRVRVNVPPVADEIAFNRVQHYNVYSGVSDEQTIISHQGRGKHISFFMRDNSLWAQSHYEKGSSIDALIGNLKIALVRNNDPESFHSWAELPALMLRQSYPFEILADWPYSTPPQVLYKANNLDIGVMNENAN